MTDYNELERRYLILIEGGPPRTTPPGRQASPAASRPGRQSTRPRKRCEPPSRFDLEGLAAASAPIPDPSGPGVYVERTVRATA